MDASALGTRLVASFVNSSTMSSDAGHRPPGFAAMDAGKHRLHKKHHAEDEGDPERSKDLRLHLRPEVNDSQNRCEVGEFVQAALQFPES